MMLITRCQRPVLCYCCIIPASTSSSNKNKASRARIHTALYEPERQGADIVTRGNGLKRAPTSNNEQQRRNRAELPLTASSNKHRRMQSEGMNPDPKVAIRSSPD